MNTKPELLDALEKIEASVILQGNVGRELAIERIGQILERLKLRGAISAALDDLVSKEVISWTITSPDPVAVDAVLSAVEGVLRLRGRDEN